MIGFQPSPAARRAVWLVLLLHLLLLLPAACAAGNAPAATPVATPGPQTSAAGLYTVVRADEASSVALNTLQTWTLHVEDAAGAPVRGAQLQVAGGMPAHDHGLPTEPHVTAEPGAGDYRVDGLQFQMPGAWVLTVTVDGPAGVDAAVLPFVVAP